MMPQDTGPKSFENEMGDIVTCIGGNLRAVSWKDRYDVHILNILINMYPATHRPLGSRQIH
jgi:hypothetical protein